MEKEIKPKKFQIGDLVLLENISSTTTSHKLKGKFQPNWIGLYVITANFSIGVYMLLYLKENKSKRHTMWDTWNDFTRKQSITNNLSPKNNDKM